MDTLELTPIVPGSVTFVPGPKLGQTISVRRPTWYARRSGES